MAKPVQPCCCPECGHCSKPPETRWYQPYQPVPQQQWPWYRYPVTYTYSNAAGSPDTFVRYDTNGASGRAPSPSFDHFPRVGGGAT